MKGQFSVLCGQNHAILGSLKWHRNHNFNRIGRSILPQYKGVQRDCNRNLKPY
jgi:hypothetical protein